MLLFVFGVRTFVSSCVRVLVHFRKCLIPVSVKIDTIVKVENNPLPPFPLLVKVDACVSRDLRPSEKRYHICINTFVALRINFDNEGKGFLRNLFSSVFDGIYFHRHRNKKTLTSLFSQTPE